ncbi:hypothetical protein M8C21_019919, partial [Ambrosia artemisiifolia]
KIPFAKYRTLIEAAEVPQQHMLTTMELSTRCIPNGLPNFASCKPYTSSLQLKLSLPLTPNTITLNNQGERIDTFNFQGASSSFSCLVARWVVTNLGLRYYNYPIKATASEEKSGGANQYVKEEPEVVNYSSIEATTPEEASIRVNQYVEEQPDAVTYSSTEATTPEEASNVVNKYVKEEADAVNYSSIEATPEEASNGVNQYVKEETVDVVTVNEGQSDESSGFGLFKDDAAAVDQFPPDDFLNKLKVELDPENSLSIALLGVGGITALWLTTSIVGAIDHIPLFPKLMELVGLGYTIWFSTRYLLFKVCNRDCFVSFLCMLI